MSCEEQCGGICEICSRDCTFMDNLLKLASEHDC